MAIKNNKTNKDNVVEQMTQNTPLDILGVETEYSEKTSSFLIDTDGLDKISINDLDVGDTADGMPEFVIFDNSDRTNNDGSKRKWDSLCCHFVDIGETDEYGEQTGEYVEAYLPIPRPDSEGNITNIFGNGFYHGAFNLIYSYLRTLDESNVLDNNGNIINTIKKVNIVKLVETLNKYDKMEIKVMKGAEGDRKYLTFMISKMQ